VLPDWAYVLFFQPNVIKSSQIGLKNVPNLATRTAYLISQDDSEGCFVFRRKLSTQIGWEWSTFKMKDHYRLFNLSHKKPLALKCNYVALYYLY
jgi:hypothetical protein